MAHSGGAMVNPNIASKMIQLFSSMAHGEAGMPVEDERAASLTKGELPVVQSVGRGLSNKEIAAELCLSEGTVRNIISTVLGKLGLRDRTQLAIWAVETGLRRRGPAVKRRTAALWGGAAVLVTARRHLAVAPGQHRFAPGCVCRQLLGYPNGSSYQVLDDAIARFEDAHPGVTVEYESGIPVDEYSEWLAGHLLLGQEPDVFFVLPEDFGLLAETGALAPLDSLLDSADGPDRSLYYDACLQAGQYNGSQLALPYESAATVMFVNRTLLEAYDIPMPENDWTWQDLYAICQTIAAAQPDSANRDYGLYGYTWQNALYANGSTLFSADGRQCYLASDSVQAAIQFTQQLTALDGGYTVTAQDFDTGHVAFRPFLFSEYRAYQPYPWRVKKYSSFVWDCLRMPAGPDGDNTSELHTVQVGISARSRHRDLAQALFVTLCADTTTQSELFLQSQGISPLRSVTEDTTLLDRIFDETQGTSTFNSATIGEIMRTAAAVPQFAAREQALAMADTAVANALANNQSLVTALPTAQREIDLYLQNTG